MENNYPKDPIEEGKPPLDLEDDLYPEDDPETDYYDSLDDLDPNPHWDMPFDDDEDDTSDDYFDPEDDFYDNIGFGYGYEG